MNEVLKRITLLREKMSEEKIDWYLITSDDFHSSEYVSDYFKVREYYTGFTGDNAFLLLNKDAAYMWTDGRFFIQAAIELMGTTIDLMKWGEEGVPTLSEFIKDNIKEGETLSFDGRTVSCKLGIKLKDILDKKGAKIVCDKDFAGELWTERPSMPDNKVFSLSDDEAGESVESKLRRVRSVIKKKDASALVLSKLDDIAWLVNLRGSDIECNPVFLSYMIVGESDCFLFAKKNAISEKIADKLSDDGIVLKDYDEFSSFLSAYDTESIMLEDESVSFATFILAGKGRNVIKAPNPTTVLKAVKNKREIERIKEITILDSVCVTKFMYWLKHLDNVSTVSELDCADKMDGLRREVEGFIELSFPTIAGYGPNAAMMHYEATKDNFSYLKPEGLFLIDSGGQYMKGTTDVTRTYSLGPVSDEIKLHFSKVVAGMLALADAKFIYGCTGRNLDIIARLPLWELGIDYKCGTGHGVGYILNVHEGPHGIRWKYSKEVEEAVLEEGMIMSDEPGVYVKDSHGIRIENVILCVEDQKTDDGRFMKFEHLTWTPIDRDVIDKKYLSPKDIERINDYHSKVFEITSKYFEGDELNWLKEVTKPL
jgi:Xaa-Pro aminopeptidase